MQVTGRMTWRTHAACIGEPLATFFGPDHAEPGGATWPAKAKAICATCPVRAPCARDALANPVHPGIDIGVQGVLSARQRIKIRQGRMTVEEAWGRPVGRPRRVRL